MLNPIEKFKRSILHLIRSLHHWYYIPCTCLSHQPIALSPSYISKLLITCMTGYFHSWQLDMMFFLSPVWHELISNSSPQHNTWYMYVDYPESSVAHLCATPMSRIDSALILKLDRDSHYSIWTGLCGKQYPWLTKQYP